MANQSKHGTLRLVQSAPSKSSREVAGLEDIIASVVATCRRPDVQVIVELDALPGVCGRPSDYLLVFANLIENAMDAMPQGGILHISAFQSGLDRLTIIVADTGAGIDQEASETLFRPFHTSRSAEGHLGMGLTLCRDLVERGGGRIWLEAGKQGTEAHLNLKTARYAC